MDFTLKNDEDFLKIAGIDSFRCLHYTGKIITTSIREDTYESFKSILYKSQSKIR